MISKKREHRISLCLYPEELRVLEDYANTEGNGSTSWAVRDLIHKGLTVTQANEKTAA